MNISTQNHVNIKVTTINLIVCVTRNIVWLDAFDTPSHSQETEEQVEKIL